MSLLGGIKNWGESRRFGQLPKAKRNLVFYAEDGGSWTHFAPIIRELTEVREQDVAYLTSSPEDPILRTENPRIHPFHIGGGSVRTMLFVGLEARVLVMTMPDLETFQIKRSKAYPVHYAYIFHSIVSTHMIYRKAAFDAFDSIFCVGPHHEVEVRATEKAYGLEEKKLIQHGYGRLDTILAEHGASERAPNDVPHVLVAPSWSDHGLLETSAELLTKILLDAGLRVTVRPHPETVKHRPEIFEGLRASFGKAERFALDTNMSASASLHASDVMISDWSGAALEYAFGLERPVLFVDVPRKVNNDEYEKVGVDPIEVTIREEIGEVVGTDALDRIPAAIARLCENPGAMHDRILRAREQHVFNVGKSGAVAADGLLRLVEEHREQHKS